MIPQENTYQVFEANQVLSKDHLNDLREYLDEQIRVTRTNLIGVGINCGLNMSVAVDGKSIRLYKGSGTTTEGYVAIIPDDATDALAKEFITLYRYLDYKVPKEIGYIPFMDQASQQYPLWELLEEEDLGSQELSTVFLSDKVLLIFVEILPESLKNCSPNACDDKGTKVTVTLRKLLIRKEDLAKIIRRTENLSAATGFQDVVNYLTARLNLPDPCLRRFNVPNTNVDNAVEIFDAYDDILLEPHRESNSATLFEHVGKALSQAYMAFSPVLQTIKGLETNPFKDHLSGITIQYRNNTKTRDIIYSQYFYDFVSDLIQAYDEFRWKGIELMALCCPPEELFPRHLMIGEIVGADKAGRKVFRHYFRPSPALNNQARLYEEVLMLFLRLVDMVKSFDIPTRATIRITPSKRGPFPLSQKAIPFYYNPKSLYTHWSHEKSTVGRANQNLSYHAAQYASQDFVKKPLEYHLEPYNFFQIEGATGMDWRQAVKEILSQIKRYRLPFDVVALNADNLVVKNDPQPPRCIDNDLDVIYKLWQKELACMLAKRTKYWASLNYSTFTYTTKRTAAGAGTVKNTKSARTAGPAAASGVETPILTSFNRNIKLTPISHEVVDDLTQADDTIGKVLTTVLNTGNVTDSNGLKVRMTDAVKLNNNVSGLKVEDYQVTVAFPIDIIAGIIDFTDAIPEAIDDMDYILAGKKYDTVKGIAQQYADALIALPDNYTYITPADKEKTLAELESLIENCLQDRLKQLAEELANRKKTVDRLLYLSEYANNHPDMQHKAGVPVDGTFILVYRETPVTTTPVTPSAAATAVDLLPASAGTVLPASEVGTVTVSKDSKVEQIAVNNEQKLEIKKELEAQLSKYGLFLEEAELTIFTDSVLGTVAETPRPGAEIPQQIVIADFYVSGRCCSDCPSVQFVLPPPRPVFDVEVGCTDANGEASVKVNVRHGIAPYQLKIDEQDYAMLGKNLPLLKVGKHTLTLMDSAGGESVPVPVEIKKPMQVDPGAKTCDATGQNYTLSILIIDGAPPFKVNDLPVLETVQTQDKKYRVLAGPFPSGKEIEVTVSEGSGCTAPPFKTNHACLTIKDDVVSTAYKTPVVVDVLKNDLGNQLSIMSTALVTPADGTLKINDDQTITYQPAEGVSGKAVVFTYQVKDSAGNTATARATVNVGENPCKLPCGGIALRCPFPFWMTEPTAQNRYETFSTGRVTFTFDGPQGEVDISGEVAAVLAASTTKLNGDYEKIVTDWIKDINILIEKRTKSKDWLRLEYGKTRDGIETLWIERFNCLKFSFALGVDYKKSQTSYIQNYKYTPQSTEIITHNVEGLAASGIKIPVANCMQTNKCEVSRDDTKKWQPAAAALDFEIEINRKTVRNVISMEAASIGKDFPTRYIWEIEDMLPRLREGEKISVPVEGNKGKKVWLTAYDKSGYATTIVQTITTPDNDEPTRKRT